MIYTVSKWPTIPYEGSNYYNVTEQKLGVYSGGRWKYYDPFFIKVPVDSYDKDFDGIPDEFDPEVPSDYPGFGPYVTPAGVSIPIHQILSPISSNSINNSDVTSTRASDCDGVIIFNDGSMRVFHTGDTITLPPKATLFCGTFIDSDSDGIPDLFDTNIGYTGTGNISGTAIDPNVFLSPINGDGSQNLSIYNIQISLPEGGFILAPDGQITFFNPGDILDYSKSSIIFLGTYGDADGDGIPDAMDTDAGYPGSGDYVCSGVNPSLFLAPVDSGSSNLTSIDFSYTTQKDVLIVDVNTCEVSFFKAGSNITLKSGSTVFAGTFIDSDQDGLPNPVDTSANYSGGVFGTTTLTPEAMFTSFDDGSTSNFGRDYTTVAPKAGIIIDSSGGLTIFKSGDSITVSSGSTVIMGVIDDANGDGIPDSLAAPVSYTSDPLLTSSGCSIQLNNLMTAPYDIVENNSGAAYSIGPFAYPVLIFGPACEQKFIGSNTSFLFEDGWTLCKPQLTSTENGINFFGLNTAGDEINLLNIESSSASFSTSYFAEENPDTLRLSSIPFVSTTDFKPLFKSIDSENITFND